MLVTFFIATALVSGCLFGWFASTEYQKQKIRREQRTILERTPTALLESELEKRGTTKSSPFR